MNKVNFPVWSDQIKETVKELNRVTNQFVQVRKKILSGSMTDCIWRTFSKNICDTLSYWTGNTYVGCRKEKSLEKAFQHFFEELYDFLLFCKNIDNPVLNKFANDSLYKGTLYRYLGHGNSKSANQAVIPEYNDIYVSWSKSPDNTYLQSKLYGIKTLLTCECDDTHYGIDLECFGVSLNSEQEVVFPTLKDKITNIEYKEEKTNYSSSACEKIVV